MNGIRELLRKRHSPITVVPGDSIRSFYRAPDGTTTMLATYEVTEALVVSETVIFEADAGVFGAGRALGGAFVEDVPDAPPDVSHDR